MSAEFTASFVNVECRRLSFHLRATFHARGRKLNVSKDVAIYDEGEEKIRRVNPR